MIPEPLIDLEFRHVSKIYQIFEAGQTLEGGPLRTRWRKLMRRPSAFRAVDDVSFQVPKGQTLGIIGHNGAGKSTILKMLSKITAPTSGEIRISGRIASLLEVGSGFHPELTGRENIFLSGSILGMRRSEIANKLEAIIDFAEVRKFIDVPTKRYSSGMFVRLGFAIAAHLEADVLLLDEVLAVGDASFQERCLARIEDLRRSGVTIVFISHDLRAVQRLCERVLVMKGGRVAYDGDANDAIRDYMQTGRFQNSVKHVGQNPVPGKITEVELLDRSGNVATHFRTGSELRVRVDLSIEGTIPRACVGVYFYDLLRQRICRFSTGWEMNLQPGNYSIEFRCAELPIQSGAYTLDVTLERQDGVQDQEWHEDCATLHVEPGPIPDGVLFAPHSWRLTELSASAGSTFRDRAIVSP